MTIEQDALNALASHDWQGNVRELENVMNRLIVVARTSTKTPFDVENVLGVHPTPTSVIVQTQSKAHVETGRVLRPDTAELCEDETITAYMRRVKLDVTTSAITQYPNKTAAAQRLGLTKRSTKETVAVPA